MQNSGLLVLQGHLVRQRCASYNPYLLPPLPPVTCVDSTVVVSSAGVTTEERTSPMETSVVVSSVSGAEVTDGVVRKVAPEDPEDPEDPESGPGVVRNWSEEIENCLGGGGVVPASSSSSSPPSLLVGRVDGLEGKYQCAFYDNWNSYGHYSSKIIHLKSSDDMEE